MATWLNESVYTGASNGTAVHTVPISPTPSAGSLLVMFVAGGALPSTPSGWTQVARAVDTAGITVYTKTAAGTESTVAVTVSASNYSAQFAVYEFADTSVFQASNFQNSASDPGPSLSSMTGTPTIMVGTTNSIPGGVSGTPNQTVTSPAGFTREHQAYLAAAGTDGAGLTVHAAEGWNATASPTVAPSFGWETSPGGVESRVIFWLTVPTTALDISVGADQSITTEQTATVTGLATGGTGTKTYAWTVTSGATGTFGTPTASTSTFTPTGGVGSSVLRCTVTDGSGSDFDELTLTVTAPPTTATPTGGTSNPTWTPYGGTVPTVLADADTATGVVSATSPTAVVYDQTFTTLKVPGVADDLTLSLGIWREAGSSGTAVARLYEGATLRSTSTSRTLPTTAAGSLTVVFPAADLAAIASGSWTSGLRVTVTVTAA